jgi:FtsP/CotA-like multicopper oxidase with cupredoxin domain
VNSVNFKTVKSFTKHFTRGLLFAFFFFAQVKVHAENRESVNEVTDAIVAAPTTELKVVAPTAAVIVKPTDKTTRQKDEALLSAIRKAVQPVEPSKEIVILNTEAGFVPQKVRVKKGEAYKIHVVNLNMKEKNVSFLMDSFTQSHNTVFGVEKSFNIEPQVEGVYSYQCPETGIQGQLIVVKDADVKRKMASYDDGN